MYSITYSHTYTYEIECYWLIMHYVILCRQLYPPTGQQQQPSSLGKNDNYLTDTSHTHIHTKCAAICTERWRSCIICNCSSTAQSVKRIITNPTQPTDDLSPSNDKKFVFQINISVCKIVQPLSRHAYQSKIRVSKKYKTFFKKLQNFI